MGSPSELSLDVKPTSHSLLLKFFGDQVDQTHLEEFLNRLEEERLKIDAFKRELPLCMQLLNNAMEASRQQLENYQTNHGLRPVLEEFMPLKHPSPDVAEKVNMVDKANWMDSAQLWSQTNSQGTIISKEMEQSVSVSPKLGLDNKQRSGGAFLPFSKERNSGRVLPELALTSGDKEGGDKKFSESENGISSYKSRETCNLSHQGGGGTVADHTKGVVSVSNTGDGQPAAGHTHRKARRSWSPDLHRRFVNALQQLGGSQVATPKQIRELMKVEGLTNDEVKSHLQKYRLHTRRPSPTPHTATAPAPQLVVLGGIWVPPEYATAAHQAAPGIYGTATMAAATAGTPYCPPGVHQDFYSQLNQQQHQLHHHHHHHVYKTSPQTQSSPQSDVGGTGRSESMEEDRKSESGSWKGDSAEKEGGRGLLSLRRGEGDEEEGESAGSEITLKF